MSLNKTNKLLDSPIFPFIVNVTLCMHLVSDETGTPTRSLRKSTEKSEMPDKSSSFRATVIAASFINKLHAPIAARKGGKSPFKEDNALWVGDLEYISSIRRPRKSVADMTHQRNLYRAKSDLHRLDPISPLPNFGSMTSLRVDTPRSKHRDNVEELLVLPTLTNEHSNESIPSQETEISPKLVRKVSRDKKTYDRHRKVSSSNVDLQKPQNIEPELKKSPRLSRKGSLENRIRTKSSIDRRHSFHHAPKSNLDISKPEAVDTEKTETVHGKNKKSNEESGDKQHKRKSSLKKKKDIQEGQTISEKPKKISFAELDDALPVRTGSLKERKSSVSSRPRSSSTGSS